MDGPNHELNFQKGILNAKNNLPLIVKYLRFHNDQDNYQELLDVYLPKLEGTEYYDEFKADVGKETLPPVPRDAATEKVKLTEEEFRDLPAKDQKELIKDLVTEENNGSNTDKRVALYLPTNES